MNYNYVEEMTKKEGFMYRESSVSELKRELSESVKKEIIAFLNASGGSIYVGVDDDGKIYEPFLKEDKDKTLLILSSWLRDSIYPLPSSLVAFAYNDDGVLELDIKEGTNKPYYLTNKGPTSEGTYKRIGTSARKCSQDEIIQMIMDSHHYVFEKEISDNQELTFKYFEMVLKEKGIDDLEKQKVSLGLINSDGEYTNLGLLLSDQSPIEVKVAEYDDHMNFKLKKTFTGSLFKVLYDVQEQASRLNDISATIDSKTWIRKETLSYPGESLREIILNAFCHSDYFLRSNIKIDFFKDKCRIISPGGLFRSSIESMLSGTCTTETKAWSMFWIN